MPWGRARFVVLEREGRSATVAVCLEFPCRESVKLVSSLSTLSAMTLTEAIETITEQLARMDELYNKPVFDEWALVSVFDRKAKILHYRGPRRDELLANFANDIRHFTAEMVAGDLHLGHFDFSRDAEGQAFDAYMVVGEGCYLVCNNTQDSMAGITRNARWLQAQVPFAELSDCFGSNPLIHMV